MKPCRGGVKMRDFEADRRLCEAATNKALVRIIQETERENARLRTALHDAINRPMGVVPDSAVEFYEQDKGGE